MLKFFLYKNFIFIQNLYRKLFFCFHFILCFHRNMEGYIPSISLVFMICWLFSSTWQIWKNLICLHYTNTRPGVYKHPAGHLQTSGRTFRTSGRTFINTRPDILNIRPGIYKCPAGHFKLCKIMTTCCKLMTRFC